MDRTSTPIPAYEELIKMKVDQRYPHFDKAAYPEDYIKEGSLGFLNEGLICVLTSNCTLIHLPQNHPWFSYTFAQILENHGYPTNTVGWAMQISHFSPAHLHKENKKWLMDKFTDEEALEVFGADLLADLGKDSPKRWLCISYDNLVHPGWCSSLTVKLSKGYRFRDARNAIKAALDALKPANEPVGFPLVASLPNSAVKPAAAAPVVKTDDTPTRTVKNRRRHR